MASGGTTVEWFGTTTFRVRHAGLHLFFDAYLDRLPGLEPVGLSLAEVDRADFVFVSHAHFDHLYGAAPIALATGATVVATPESARFLRADGVPDDQILMVTGGETVRCGPHTAVRVLPSLHACLFAATDTDSAISCLGDLGVSAQDRWAKVRSLFEMFTQSPGPVAQAFRAALEHSSVHDGGQMAYLLQTAEGSALFSCSSGYWPGIFRELRPDVAFLAMAGRPNVAGEPYQGSAATYVLEQIETLRAGRVAFCHHDPLVPGHPGNDIGAARALVEERRAGAYVELEYAAPFPLFV